MRRYLNLNGNSGVVEYEIGDDFILVKFRGDNPTYRYSYALAGKKHVDRMKALAVSGRLLGTYISRNVHHLNDRDWQA